MIRYFYALASIVFTLGCGALRAQSTFGEIRGAITDQSAAVVPGAAILVKNTGTSEERRVQSDSAGNFAAINLDAGTYEVTVEAAGFRKAIVRQVLLRAREIARVDVRLDVASAATEVQVTESRQVIQTDTSTIADSKTSAMIQALPVNFRAGTTNSVFSAISFTPGVQTSSTGGELSLAGSMPFQATATIDGISSINVRSGGLINEMFPSAETIDEIRVSSVNNNAEFAQLGDVTTTSKAGTNSYHGALFWYHQNGAMDARDFFSSRIGAPFKISNDFGGSMGGPVIKNKTFFFGAWEGLRYRAQSQINVTVPPDSYRTGDLSSVTAAIRDPLNNNQPFAGNIIPPGRISPVSSRALEIFQRQNVAGNSISSPNYRDQKAAANENNQFDVRGDHVFNESHNVFARYSWKNVTTRSPIGITTLGDGRESVKSRALTAAWNWVVKPTLVNEFRAGFSNRPRLLDFGPNGEPFNGPAFVKTLGINGLRSDPPNVASVLDLGITGFTTSGRSRGFGQLSRTTQFADNVTWTKGKHQIKFGGDLRFIRATDNISFFSGDDLGEYRFNGMWSGNPMGDYLLGYTQRARVANTGKDVDFRSQQYAFFIQDDWKMTSKLTLNFGVRYELQPPFWDSTLQLANFDRDFPGGRVVVPNKESLALTGASFRASIGNTPIVTAAEAGYPEKLRWTDKNNFMPRFGFAYRPWGNRTVIRGGYGVYNVTILGSLLYSLAGIHTSDTRTYDNFAVGGVPQYTFQNPFGTGLGTLPAVGNTDFRRGNGPHDPTPYAQQWNLTIERDLGGNTGLRITYQGSHSIKLFHSPDLNQVKVNSIGYAAARLTRPYPNWAIVYSRDVGTSAKYNALLVEITRRMSKGLMFQSSWAWSKNLTNATGSNSTGFAGEVGSVPTDRFNLGLDYGNASPTRRHRWLTIFMYEIPYRQNKAASGWDRVARAALGSWDLSGIILLQTGPFLTPVTAGNTDPSGTNVDSRASNRPDWARNDIPDYGNLTKDKRTIAAWFDRSLFTPAPNFSGRFGYVGPGQLVGPGTQTVSMKLAKNFYFTERINLHLEGSATNLLNRANFGIPAMTITAANFGNITSTQQAEFGGGRTLQVGMRLMF